MTLPAATVSVSQRAMFSEREDVAHVDLDRRLARALQGVEEFPSSARLRRRKREASARRAINVSTRNKAPPP